MVAGNEKADRAKMTGDVWTHRDWRGGCARELVWDVMLVGIGRLRGSCIWQSPSCSFRSPLTAASLPNKGAVG